MPSLDDLYEMYCGAAAELNAAPGNGPRREQLQEKADQLWKDYIGQHGGREVWHTPTFEWKYDDGFEPMIVGHEKGPVAEFRTLFRLPSDLGPQFTLRDNATAIRFRKSHNLPVANGVDRPTWQAMLKVKGERKAAKLPRGLELPGHAGQSIPLVIRTRKRWVLALDDVEERTYANHHNLALMSVLAYADVSDKKHVEDQMSLNWREPRLLEDVHIRDRPGKDGGVPWRALMREDSSGLYEYGTLSDDATHTQGFVLSHPKHILIAIRGTEIDPTTVDGIKAMIADLSSDFDAAAQRWMFDGTLDERGWAAGQLGFTVHKGFYDAFDSIREQLASHLRGFRKDNPHKPIFICGHSLGGAVAALTACYLRSHHEFSRHPIQLYTYAQPRVGTLPFAQHYWTRHAHWAGKPTFRYFRTAHVFDWITMIPNAYLADNVADVADLVLDFSAKIQHGARGLVDWNLVEEANESRKKWVRDRLNETAPPLDFRHFGVPVLCLHGKDDHPYIVEEPASRREVEDESIPRLQTVREAEDAAGDARVDRIWDHIWTVSKHQMGSYLTHGLHSFEHKADDYLRGRDTFPLLASPPLPPLARELHHRFVHQAPHVELHSQEKLRRDP